MASACCAGSRGASVGTRQKSTPLLSEVKRSVPRRWRDPTAAAIFVPTQRGTPMLIDVHNHFYPPEYLDALRAGDSVVTLTVDAEGNPCVHYPGDFNVAVRGH